MRENAQFVIVEWIDDVPGFPRHGFATMKHAEELGENVRWLDRFASSEAAAKSVGELNSRDASAPDGQSSADPVWMSRA